MAKCCHFHNELYRISTLIRGTAIETLLASHMTSKRRYPVPFHLKSKAVFSVVPVSDVMQPGANVAEGLPAKTLQ